MSKYTKKEAIDYNLIATCHHEASHAICALLNYIMVPDVCVQIDGPDAIGFTSCVMYKDYQIIDKELYKILLILDIQFYYAGLIGEKIFYKDISGSDKFPINLRIGSSSDNAEASKLIRDNSLATPGKPTSLFKKRIKKETGEKLIENWQAVKLLAHTLYKQRKLLYKDMKYILTHKTDNKDFWKQLFKDIQYIYNDNKIPPEGDVKEILLDNSIYSI